MTNNYLLVFAILGWALTIYFGFFRYRQYIWSRKKVHYDLFTRINQRSDRLYLSLSVMIALPRKGQKGKAKFNALLHKYLEGIFEKILMIRATDLPDKLVLFWISGIQMELKSLSDQDKNFVPELLQKTKDAGWEIKNIDPFLPSDQNVPGDGSSIRIALQLLV